MDAPEVQPDGVQTPDWKVLLAGIVRRSPAYLRLGWALAKSPEIPRSGKAGLLGGVLYSLSPVDLVPGFIPVLGQLDDIGVLLTGIRSALRNCPPEEAARLLERSGVSEERLDSDLEALAPIAKGFSGTVARGAWKGTKAISRVVGHGVAVGAKGLWKAYQRKRA